jgi:hypothetical protein|nr:MAG TPA: hypothetical protein [Caudoviricetes sp.]
MKKITNTTEEKTTKTSLLQPFPFNEDEKYLLKTTSGIYAIARWSCGKFDLDYDPYYETISIEVEIESIVSLKDLGL